MDLSRVRRIVVAGTSGSGKTTLARRIAAVTGIPDTELDGLFHLAGWTPNPGFEDEVRALAVRPAWVTELQYTAARPILIPRAELLVWLDLPRRVVLRRVVGRTVARSLDHAELWNGNVEPPLRTVLTDPDHIVRWSMRTHTTHPGHVRAALAANPALRLVRIRSRRDADRLLALLAPPGRLPLGGRPAPG